MTQEEKAKAYDEALKVAKDIKNGEAAYIPDGTSVIEAIFPELKESGNIRIIKAIKYGLDHVFTNNTTVFEVTKEQCLAWLEKQGKNNMGISEATKQKLEDNLNKALEKETPESLNKFLDEQGEQKPAWSEEDDKMVDRISEDLDELEEKSSWKYIDEQINWLKSLKERYTWKPSEGHLKALEGAMNKYHGSYSATLCQLYGELEKLKK